VVALTDTDIVLKLAACRLLGDLPDLVDVPPQDVRVLNALRFQLRKQERVKERYTPEGVQRALDFLDDARELSEASYEEYEALLGIEGIDLGEAVLFAQTKRFDDFRLLTGDKNSLRALADAPSLNATKKRLAGCVFCFEQLMLRFIDALGFEVVRRRVVPVRSCDGVLDMAFRDGEQTTQERATRYLEARTPDDLRVASAPLLAAM
jgi:hypothetical protein